MEILELREVDGDNLGYSVQGYYCVGHVNKVDFAIAVNEQFELAEAATVFNVFHIYARKVPIARTGFWRFVKCQQGRGAFKCTYLDLENQ